MVKNLPSMQEMKLWSLGQEDPLEKGMAIHSSILAWRIIMVKGVWWATVHGFTKSRTRLSFYYIRVYLDSFLKKWDNCNPLQEDFFQFTFWFRSPSPMLIFILALCTFSSVQLLSCMQLCNPMNHSTSGLHVHHQLPEFTQTHVHQVGDAIQPSHPLPSTSPPAPNPSQHQGLFKWVNSSHEVAKVLEFQLQRQSFQWTPRTDLL